MTTEEKFNQKFRVILVFVCLALTALYLWYLKHDQEQREHNIEFHSEIKDTI